MPRRKPTFMADRPCRPTAGTVDLSLVIDHERAMSKRQARAAQSEMRANDLEYDRRMDCGRTRDAVRTIKENGYDKTHPVFVKAAKQARYARMLYISKYKRDPFTLAPVDERGNAVDVDLGAASWTEVK